MESNSIRVCGGGGGHDEEAKEMKIDIGSTNFADNCFLKAEKQHRQRQSEADWQRGKFVRHDGKRKRKDRRRA